MDFADLKARADKAREFESTQGDITYRLRVLTRPEVLAVAHSRGLWVAGNDVASALLLRHALLDAAVVGWTGARVSHVLPDLAGTDEGKAPLPWAADAVRLLLDAQPEHCDALAELLTEKTQQRTKAIEADAKN